MQPKDQEVIQEVIHDMFISTINSTNPDDIQNWIPSLINGNKLQNIQSERRRC